MLKIHNQMWRIDLLDTIDNENALKNIAFNVTFQRVSKAKSFGLNA